MSFEKLVKLWKDKSFVDKQIVVSLSKDKLFVKRQKVCQRTNVLNLIKVAGLVGMSGDSDCWTVMITRLNLVKSNPQGLHLKVISNASFCLNYFLISVRTW